MYDLGTASASTATTVWHACKPALLPLYLAMVTSKASVPLRAVVLDPVRLAAAPDYLPLRVHDANGTPHVLRSACLEDRPAMLQVMEAALAPHVSAGRLGPCSCSILSGLGDDSVYCFCLVLVSPDDDSAVRGSVALVRSSANDVLELAQLYLDQRWRNRGIGFGLLSIVLQSAPLYGARRVVVETSSCLTTASNLYLRNGFKQVPLDVTAFRAACKRCDIMFTREVEPAAASQAVPLENVVLRASDLAAPAGSVVASRVSDRSGAVYTLRLGRSEDKQAMAAVMDEALDGMGFDPCACSLLSQLGDHGVYYCTLLLTDQSDDETVCGSVSLMHTRRDDTLQLGQLYLRPSLQRRGLGYALLQVALTAARHAGASRVLLETETRLKAAIELYQRNGFHRVPVPSASELTRVPCNECDQFWVRRVQRVDSGMYVPRDMEMHDTRQLMALMRAAPFATLISTGGRDVSAAPRITRLPLLYLPAWGCGEAPAVAALRKAAAQAACLPRSDCGYLFGHVAYANRHWQAFAPMQHGIDDAIAATVVFDGPHAYISPTWYDISPAVPTWNYASVVARGIPRHITVADVQVALLHALVKEHEPKDSAYDDTALPVEYRDKQLRHLRFFVMPIDTLSGKFKLNQNKTEASNVATVKALRSTEHGRELADLMAGLVVPDAAS